MYLYIGEKTSYTIIRVLESFNTYCIIHVYNYRLLPLYIDFLLQFFIVTKVKLYNK